MFGWPTDAAARASRSKRAGSASRPSSLIATRRSSSSSVASQTSDIAPRPSRSSSRYRPPMTTPSDTAVAYVGVAGLLTMEEALALVLERVRPLPAETVPLERAVGRVLAGDARAAVDLPPFASSAMDGFAVRVADTPGELPVVARIAAGRPAERELQPGEAMAISTGGVVPVGADGVVPIERVVQFDNNIGVPDAVVQNDNIRPRGGDIRAGEVVVERGTRIGPAQAGALAAAGIAEVRVARRPRAAVLSTGTELRAPGEELGPGEIYEANSHLLAAALAAAGAE